MPQLRAAATAVQRLVFLDTAGRERAGVSLSAFQGSAGDREVEISRADLAATLLEAARDNAEIRWGDAITGLEQAGDAVDVTFERGAPAHFDLAIGADGSHSAVRRLAFGPDSDFVRHMGMYVATLPVDHTIAGEDAVAMVNAPGCAFSVHPARGIPLAGFFFRQRAVPDFDYRDLEQHKRLIAAAYSGKLGVYEEFLDSASAADDLYLDAVSRVSLPHWSIGRIGVVGDAASSLSLFGDGSTLAIIGAHTLAAELASTPGDISGALARYERRHRAVVRPKLRGFTLARMLLVPGSRANITARNLAVRAMDTVL